MAVPPARTGALEDLMHQAAPTTSLFVFDPDPAGRPYVLGTELDHRAIGVVYHPDRERWGNYVPTVLGDRYDAFLWFDRTRGVRPLYTLPADAREPETYPTGV
jgi:erythromycin esterase-like protein